jgi:hypothetical protein
LVERVILENKTVCGTLNFQFPQFPYVSPNLFELLAYINDDDMYVENNSVVVIFSATLRSPLKIPLPATI